MSATRRSEGGPHARPLDPDHARAFRDRARLLDVRDAAAFASAHVRGSGHVPIAQLAARRHELPSADTPVLVVGEDAVQAHRAAETLTGLGFVEVAWLDAAWSALDRWRDSGPGARLWSPAPFLEQVLPRVPRGPALDVACGAGRDAVFLALSGFEVEAVDLDAAALARAADLARRNAVYVAFRSLDLEAEDASLGVDRFALVTCFRFLHRPLLPALRRALAPGGHLVIETFRAGQERHGKPKRPQFLLRAGELRAAFADLEVLSHEEPEPEGGPVTARLHARRRA